MLPERNKVSQLPDTRIWPSHPPLYPALPSQAPPSHTESLSNRISSWVCTSGTFFLTLFWTHAQWLTLVILVTVNVTSVWPFRVSTLKDLSCGRAWNYFLLLGVLFRQSESMRMGCLLGLVQSSRLNFSHHKSTVKGFLIPSLSWVWFFSLPVLQCQPQTHSQKISTQVETPWYPEFTCSWGPPSFL